MTTLMTLNKRCSSWFVKVKPVEKCILYNGQQGVTPRPLSPLIRDLRKHLPGDCGVSAATSESCLIEYDNNL